MEERIENLNKKSLRNFVKGNTIYISKINNDFSHIYFCEFVGLEKGMVVARILGVDTSWEKHKIGEEIRSRARNCFLWGVDKRMGTRSHPWKRCHWFKSLDSEAQ